MIMEGKGTKEMSDKICELIENEEKRLEFSKHAKDNCGKFSEATFTNKWIEIINNI